MTWQYTIAKKKKKEKWHLSKENRSRKIALNDYEEENLSPIKNRIKNYNKDFYGNWIGSQFLKRLYLFK